jgi:hypothetical protein
MVSIWHLVFRKLKVARLYGNGPCDKDLAQPLSENCQANVV